MKMIAFSSVLLFPTLFMTALAAPAPAPATIPDPAPVAVDPSIDPTLDAIAARDILLGKRYVSCSTGSGFNNLLCKDMSESKCQGALGQFDDNTTYSGRTKKGQTSGLAVGSCTIYIDGDSRCQITGKTVKAAYAEIRAGGCKQCGETSVGDFCKVRIARV